MHHFTDFISLRAGEGCLGIHSSSSAPSRYKCTAALVYEIHVERTYARRDHLVSRRRLVGRDLYIHQTMEDMVTTDALRQALKLTKEGGAAVVAAVAVLQISKASSTRASPLALRATRGGGCGAR